MEFPRTRISGARESNWEDPRMALFGKKKPSVQDGVLDRYTHSVTVWCQALAQRQGTSGDTEFTSAVLSAVGDAPELEASLIPNEVSRDLCIITARKWLPMETSKFARAAQSSGHDADFWDAVGGHLHSKLPRTTTL